jgi:hypothetical protein
MSAVELKVAGMRNGFGDVTGKGDRYELVPAAPDKQGFRLECPEPRPEAVLPVRFLEVDLSGRGVERRPAGRSEVCAQKLVDAGGRPAVIGARDDAANDRVDQRPRG